MAFGRRRYIFPLFSTTFSFFELSFSVISFSFHLLATIHRHG
jgi:hypothetical protein